MSRKRHPLRILAPPVRSGFERAGNDLALVQQVPEINAAASAASSSPATATGYQKEANQMWKPSQPEYMPSNLPSLAPGPVMPARSIEEPVRVANPNLERSVIGKGLIVKGEISGTEPLFIDGRVEGIISLPGSRVTLGRNGQIGANISAREVVVSGKMRGNVVATESIDIRAEGSLNGDVAAARISIEDGAYFKGGIDIRKPEPRAVAQSEAIQA